jgi:hypothetical protein
VRNLGNRAHELATNDQQLVIAHELGQVGDQVTLQDLTEIHVRATIVDTVTAITEPDGRVG